jgi:hypothetical protein
VMPCSLMYRLWGMLLCSLMCMSRKALLCGMVHRFWNVTLCSLMYTLRNVMPCSLVYSFWDVTLFSIGDTSLDEPADSSTR